LEKVGCDHIKAIA
jgi:hypothetical protein